MRKRIFTATFVAVSLIAGLANAAEFEVKMLNKGAKGGMVFEPELVIAAPGDTVEFILTNNRHNDTDSDGARDTWPYWPGHAGRCRRETVVRLCIDIAGNTYCQALDSGVNNALLHVSAIAWFVAFTGFSLVFAPSMLRQRRAEPAPSA